MQEAVFLVVSNFVDLEQLNENEIEVGIAALTRMISSLNDQSFDGENLLEKRILLENECQEKKKKIAKIEEAKERLDRDIAACQDVVEEKEKEYAVLNEVQESFVGPFLKATTEEKKMLILDRIHTCKNKEFENIKAFRMIREKLERLEDTEREQEEEQQKENEEHEYKATYSKEVMGALQIIRKQLKNDSLDSVKGMVIQSVLDCEKELRKVQEKKDWNIVLEAFRLMLKHRFEEEPDIPLYVALHHNSLMFLKNVCKECELFPQMALCSMEGARVLSRFLERVKDDIHSQLQLEKEAEADERGEGNEKERVEARARELQKAVKRCLFEISGVKKAWNDVLAASLLKWCVGELVGHVLDEAIISLTFDMCKEEISVEESSIFAKTFRDCLDSCLPVLGLDKKATEFEKRKRVPSYPRARKIVELMCCSMNDLERNLTKLSASFTKEELEMLIIGMFDDNNKRAQIINKIT